MAKRKREIQKRKRQQDSGPEYIDEAVDTETAPGSAGYPGESGAEVYEPSDGEPQGAPGSSEKWASTVDPGAAVKDTWFSRNGENLLLGLLVLYVLLLGLGTVGELFEIEWILNLPLFK
jgi:hypothetical protein